jgi:serine/threonine protein kinase
MVAGQLPFESANIGQMLTDVIYSKPDIPDSLSPSCRDLIERCLAKDPQARISLPEIRKHLWITAGEGDELLELPDMTDIESRISEEIQAIQEPLEKDEIEEGGAVHRIMKRKVVRTIMRDNLPPPCDGLMSLQHQRRHSVSELFKTALCGSPLQPNRLPIRSRASPLMTVPVFRTRGANKQRRESHDIIRIGLK